MSAYEIEFEDHGQDMLRMTVDAKSGLITDTSAHPSLYAGTHYVDTERLRHDRHLHFRAEGESLPKSFRWPMVKLSLDDEVIHDLTDDEGSAA